jgi:hypothetical protein
MPSPTPEEAPVIHIVLFSSFIVIPDWAQNFPRIKKKAPNLFPDQENKSGAFFVAYWFVAY